MKKFFIPFYLVIIFFFFFCKSASRSDIKFFLDTHKNFYQSIKSYNDCLKKLIEKSILNDNIRLELTLAYKNYVLSQKAFYKMLKDDRYKSDFYVNTEEFMTISELKQQIKDEIKKNLNYKEKVLKIEGGRDFLEKLLLHR